MGYYKSIHIDCYPGECYALGEFETCYQQPGNTSYIEQDIDPEEPGTTLPFIMDEPLN